MSGKPGFESLSDYQITGYSSVWPECRTWNAEVVGSNPTTLTNYGGVSSVAERLTVNQETRVRSPTSPQCDGRL